MVEDEPGARSETPARGHGEDQVGLADTIASPEQAHASHRRERAPGASAVQDEGPDPGLSGTRLDHFQLERPLGRGGMGAVYVAQDVSLDRRVAIKMLRDETERDDRLLLEARAQAKLNHPGVVHIYYIGRRQSASPDTAGPLFVAMELIEGQSLEERYIDAGRRMEPETARRRMIEVARALRAAQHAGILHRDVKPSNLLCDANGAVKIADFGLAQQVEGTAPDGRDDALVGSPFYMAPEQGRGEAVDHRSDMYSLGATFFHLMSGSPPYEDDSVLAVITRHASDPVPSLQASVPEIPAALLRIVNRLMAKDPADRFASYDELIAALEDAAPEATTYAGFWLRGAAMFIDFVVAGILIALVGWAGMLLHLLHVTIGHAARGQTLAKYLLNVQVRRLDGRSLGIGRSLARTLVQFWLPFVVGIEIVLTEGIPELKQVIEQLRPNQVAEVENLLWAFLFGNGFMSLLYVGGLVLAAFHAQKRALHDLAVGSVVSYRFERGSGGAPKRTRADRVRASGMRKLLGKDGP